MNPFLVLREDISSNRLAFGTFVAMIAVTLSFSIAILSLERSFQQTTNAVSSPFSLLAVPPGNKYAQLMQFAFLKPSQMELLPAKTVADLLADTDGADYVSPLGFGDNYLGYPLIGVTPNFVDFNGKLQFKQGNKFTHPFQAVIGAKIPLDVGSSFSPEHGLKEDNHHEHDKEFHKEGEGHDIQYTITGKLKARGNIWDYAILVPIETVWHLHGLPSGHKLTRHFEDLIVGPPYESKLIPQAPAVVFGFSKNHLAQASKIRYKYNGKKNVDVFAPAEILLDIYKYLGDGKKLLLTVAFSSVVIVLTSIFLSIIGSLESFAPKLMLLRVLGAPRRFIFLIVWLKSMVLTCCGAFLGAIGGLAVAKVMAIFLTSSTYLTLKPTLGLTELYVIFCLIVAGCIAATIPALLVISRSPAEVLRGNSG